MKRQIRQGVFETNSSSTHAICIETLEHPYTIVVPKELKFTTGKFGWGYHKEINDTEEKARYLFTALFYLNNLSDINKYLKFIKDTLTDVGVKAKFDDSDLRVGIFNWEDPEVYLSVDDGYIDHGDELDTFIEEVCSDKEKLVSYLFSNKSFITTGNDNEGPHVEIDVEYPHYEYHKGN